MVGPFLFGEDSRYFGLMRITLMRHGETDLNASNVWQGHSIGELSDLGKGQVRKAVDRIDPGAYDVVVASDLTRAVQSAELLGLPFEVDRGWREIDVGDWSGRRYAEIAASEPEVMAAVMRGEDVVIGGGESFNQLSERVLDAFTRLAARIGDDGSALVVTHGGSILSLVADHWNISRGFDAPVIAPTNTSFTTFEHDYGSWKLNRYNDGSHLGLLHGQAADYARGGSSILTFVRHGETEANVRQVWQGQGDWGLNDQGRLQASALAAVFSPTGPIYASPSGRAAQTAATLDGHGVTHVDGLMEIAMGRWEGLEVDAVKTGWADHFERTFVGGEDLRRGETGENVAELMLRLRNTVDEIMANHPSEHVAFVSHGSAIRSFVVSVLGGANREFRNTGIVPNTGLSHVVLTDGRYRLADYGVAPHLAALR